MVNKCQPVNYCRTMLNFIPLFLLEILGQEFFLCGSVSVCCVNDAFQVYECATFQLNYGMVYSPVCCCRLLVTWMTLQSEDDLETHC